MQKIEEQPTTEEENKKSKVGVRVLIDFVVYAIIIFLCLNVIPKYVIQRTIVDGTSMADTLDNGDNLIVEKVSYHFDKLDRFDVIVFYPYGRDSDEYYIKRIIGLPGESVQIIGDEIYIDGELLEENYGKDPMTYSGIASQPYELADDEYFVLGDNRSISMDSRYYQVGPVHKKDIGGKAILRIWPFGVFGKIH